MNISRPISIEHLNGDEDTVMAVMNHSALPQTIIACAITSTEVLSLKMSTLKYESSEETAGACMFDICLYPAESIMSFFRFVSEFCEMTTNGGINFPAAFDISIGSDDGDPTEDRKIQIRLNRPEEVAGFCEIVREVQDRIARTRLETLEAASHAA